MYLFLLFSLGTVQLYPKQFDRAGADVTVTVTVTVTVIVAVTVAVTVSTAT